MKYYSQKKTINLKIYIIKYYLEIYVHICMPKNDDDNYVYDADNQMQNIHTKCK